MLGFQVDVTRGSDVYANVGRSLMPTGSAAREREEARIRAPQSTEQTGRRGKEVFVNTILADDRANSQLRIYRLIDTYKGRQHYDPIQMTLVELNTLAFRTQLLQHCKNTTANEATHSISTCR